MTKDLTTRWVQASFAIGKIGDDPFGGHITYEIQSLGRLDVELRAQDADIEALFNADSPEPNLELSRYLDLSRLWVLSGYELVRTLSACVTAGLWAPGEDLAEQLSSKVKRTFTLVRMPLAKFEPAFKSRRATPGDLVAEPSFAPGQGAAWTIAEGANAYRVIVRNQLADQLLGFLEGAREANPKLPMG